MKFLFLTLLFLTSLYANKVIYLSYDEVPQRVIKGEIFPIVLKSLSTVKNLSKIQYNFSNAKGIKFLSTRPKRVKKGKYFYDTFYALSTKNSARLPDINATLVANKKYESTYIYGQNLNIISLNPKKNFSNIIADNFALSEYKTTSYDNKHNIIVLVATAKNSDIKAMHFQNIKKQGIESLKESHLNSKITYFLIVDKNIENFTFSYFNLIKNNFIQVTIPIIVDDDSVTTQSDLKPKDQSKERLKMAIASVFVFVMFLLILWRKKFIYLLLLILPLIYIIYLALPEKEICIKEGTQIYLLPVNNGTIFETTNVEYRLLKEGRVQNFIKVKLLNEKIGWVKDEDICSN